MTEKRMTWTAAIVALTVLLAPASAVAEEHRWTTVTYVASMDVRPVGDVAGHVVGTFVRRGLALNANGDVGINVNAGTLDLTKGAGTSKGTTRTTWEDGSTIETTYTISIEPGPGGTFIHKGTGEFTKGTGRFARIKGTYSATGKTYTPLDDETKAEAVYYVRANYTLPKE
jgi:hypothetical protein